MIEIEKTAWEAMVAHAQNTFPNECCGAMLGRLDDGRKVVTEAVAVENAYGGAQQARYEIKPGDLLAAEREARNRGMESDRDFSLASRLRCLFFGNRS